MTESELPILILTVGLPRAGKSSWAQEQIETGAAIVCPDSIRKALGCYPFEASREDEVWKIVRTMVRALFESGHPVVILDATNVTKEKRTAWDDARWRTRYQFFDTSVIVCKGRALASGQDYLLPVIDRMAASADFFIQP